ncbi:DNA methyltransferase [Caulobacter phage TMCBR2]|uniref:Methyltransferase n=2 Tax=Kronosvirus TaxID=3425745 RepID=A0AAE9ZH16_9CAUD|nr:DNA methyltransferase [Caulobacter phage TMCBR2]WDS38308.1 DNA methyltransferase [Caulobacter phage TMCBR3]WDS38367.1 hypothetical protein TMCBR4_gp058 [Caulobacter phage TMCBR4]WDS38425.1 DNA methyltransferase [Caulobacter phage W2]
MSFAQEAGGVAKVRDAHKRRKAPAAKGQKSLALKGGRTKAHAKPKAKGTGKRRKHELYETPEEGTLALVNRYRERLATLDTWEPACGRSRLANVLRLQFPAMGIIQTDLIDHGNPMAVVGLDFTTCPWPSGCNRSRTGIITNPPFNDGDPEGGGLAARFIHRAVVVHKAPFVAMLVKAGFWHAANRQGLFREAMPTRIHPLAFRLDFTGDGSPAMEMLWVVWDELDRLAMGPGAFPPYEPLERPRMGADGDLFDVVRS